MPSAALATTGTTLTATEYNYLPRGLLASSSVLTSSYTTTGTHTTFQDVTNLSASVTYAANRILRVVLEVNPYPSGGANGISFRLIRGSTTLRDFQAVAAAMDTGAVATYSFVHTFAGPSSGATETFKAQINASVNNTAVQAYGSALYPYRLYVEDLGSQ